MLYVTKQAETRNFLLAVREQELAAHYVGETVTEDMYPIPGALTSAGTVPPSEALARTVPTFAEPDCLARVLQALGFCRNRAYWRSRLAAARATLVRNPDASFRPGVNVVRHYPPLPHAHTHVASPRGAIYCSVFPGACLVI